MQEDILMWNDIIKVCSVIDKHYSSTEHVTEGLIREKMVEFEVSEGSTMY